MAARRQIETLSTVGALGATAWIVLLGLSAGAAGSQAAPLRDQLADQSTGYAQVRQVCPAPKRRAASCLVLALEPASDSSQNARPYVRGAGSSATGPAGGLTPADLASAYAYAGATGGAGQTLALVDAYDDPNVEADLGKFDANYGLPACTKANGCFNEVGQTGSTGALPKNDTAGWTLEIALDVETAHSVCPACRILLVEADSESLSDLAAATDEAVALGATEVSNSYGALENELGARERAAYDHPGVVITAAAGDSGYLNWDRLVEVLEAPGLPDAPASLPTVVAVGGTSLKLSAAGLRRSETVWNDSGPPSGSDFEQFAATGGGCSTFSEAEGWQQSVSGWNATGCGTRRLDNDVAAVGDPYTGFDIYSSYKYTSTASTGWITVGGTSLSSPLIAGLYALAGGSHGVSYPAQTLYEHLGQSSLYDVTKGGNGYCDGVEPGPCGEPAVNEELGDVDCLGTTACDARPGYDGPSGVGAPVGLGAFGAPPPPSVLTDAASGVSATSATLNATVNPNGSAVTRCAFEWGTSSAYGQSVPCEHLPGSGTSPVAVSAKLTGLAAGTRYYFRISAANTTAAVAGKGKQLKTHA